MGDYSRLRAQVGCGGLREISSAAFGDSSVLPSFFKARNATILGDNGQDHDSDKRLGALCGFRLRYWNMADDGWRLTRRSAVLL